MKLHAINHGPSRQLSFGGKTVETAFIKNPTSGLVSVNELGLVEDEQADLSVHGGKDKAIYCYPIEFYKYWEEKLKRSLNPGAFGENLTIAGLPDSFVYLGDIIKIGEVRLQITQPRLPCFKLNFAFQRSTMLKEFIEAGLFGYYTRVVKSGQISTNDDLSIERQSNSISIAKVVEAFQNMGSNKAQLKEVLSYPYLADQTRSYFLRKLD